jgi:hypothetical protein
LQAGEFGLDAVKGVEGFAVPHGVVLHVARVLTYSRTHYLELRV